MQGSAIITINKDGIILSVDKNCCRLFGFELDELVGNKINCIIPSPYKEQHDTYLANYLRTKIPRIIGKSRVAEGQTKDGHIFPIKLSVSKVGEGEDIVFVGMIDKMEDKIAAITINNKGIIISCNQNVEELFGYKSDDLIGNNVKMLMSSPHRDQHDTYLHNFLTGGKPKVIGHVRNVMAQHRSGTVFPICLQVEHVRMGSIELFRGKIEKVDSMEAVFTIDDGGIIISCNHNFVLPLFGYTSSELVGKNISDLIPQIHQPSTQKSQALSSFLSIPTEERPVKRTKTVTFDETPTESTWKEPGVHTKELRHKDGSLFPINLEIHPFQDSDGHNLFSGKIKRSGYDDEERTSKSIGDYFILKTIGQGTYGKVKMGAHKVTKKQVAIKILQKSEMKPAELERAKRETDIMKHLQHPNIAALYDVIETPEALHMVMEYGGRTLLSYVMERGGLSEKEAHTFFLEMLSAIEYCHNLNIIHRDIKHQNILLDDEGKVKLIDFGLSNFMQEGKLRSTFCGTPAYAAPEMILGKKYVGPEVDIWSLGVVLFSMITGGFPFENVCDILSGNYKDPAKAGPKCCDLLRKMLTVDTAQRYSLKSILEHEWVIKGPSPFSELANGDHADQLTNDNNQSTVECIDVECQVLSTNPKGDAEVGNRKAGETQA